MINKSNLTRVLSSGIAVAVLVLIAGHFTQSFGQDPFRKRPDQIPRKVLAGPGGKPIKAGPPPVMPVGAPPIEQRIEYYKRMREESVASGTPMPKVTSVLTLGEMSVTGIFRTPRGFAAMVEATPIKLSYTIYPGEKFFDGQLVAIEENRLVFRKVLKMSNGKFLASVENKALRQYTTNEIVQGTEPVKPGGDRPMETAANVLPVPVDTKMAPGSIVSPVDEMSNAPTEGPKVPSKTKPAKSPVKRPVKVAASGPKVTRE
jgi:hypothetical protein